MAKNLPSVLSLIKVLLRTRVITQPCPKNNPPATDLGPCLSPEAEPLVRWAQTMFERIIHGRRQITDAPLRTQSAINLDSGAHREGSPLTGLSIDQYGKPTKFAVKLTLLERVPFYLSHHLFRKARSRLIAGEPDTLVVEVLMNHHRMLSTPEWNGRTSTAVVLSIAMPRAATIVLGCNRHTAAAASGCSCIIESRTTPKTAVTRSVFLRATTSQFANARLVGQDNCCDFFSIFAGHRESRHGLQNSHADAI